ncbi:MAG: site-specific integrase [Balneolaceae bacterium]
MEFKVYPFKRSKKYRLYVRFYDQYGQEKNLSTGVTYPLDASKKVRDKAKKEAEAIAEDKIIEFYQHGPRKAKPKIETLSVFLKNHYYPHVRSNLAESTYISYSNALSHFIRICGSKPIAAYSKTDIQQYKITRFDSEDIKKTTINIEMRSIKAAFSWAYKNDYLERHPFKGQDFMFDSKTKRRAFKKHEIEKLLKQTEGKMIGLAIRLAYFTGMRVGELSQTKWRMVNIKDRYIHLPSSITKSSKARIIPISNQAFNLIKILESQLQTKRKNHEGWFKDIPVEECYLLQKGRGFGRYEVRSIQDTFRSYMDKAGLPEELKFHCLRHSFATHVLEKGADIYAVSKVMGHSTPNVTSQFYDHTNALNYRDVMDLL